jgi:hypothetical protein
MTVNVSSFGHWAIGFTHSATSVTGTITIGDQLSHQRLPREDLFKQFFDVSAEPLYDQPDEFAHMADRIRVAAFGIASGRAQLLCRDRTCPGPTTLVADGREVRVSAAKETIGVLSPTRFAFSLKIMVQFDTVNIRVQLMSTSTEQR